LEFHEQIKDGFPFKDYVVDIVVLKNKACQIIELNPMGASMSSGSALYNWSKDFSLLQGITKFNPPPIRVLKQLIDEENSKIN